MAYKVTVAFVDMQDGLHEYGVGDEYPRRGATATPERIEALSTWKNSRGTPLIEKVDDDGNVRDKRKVRKPVSGKPD